MRSRDAKTFREPLINIKEIRNNDCAMLIEKMMGQKRDITSKIVKEAFCTFCYSTGFIKPDRSEQKRVILLHALHHFGGVDFLFEESFEGIAVFLKPREDGFIVEILWFQALFDLIPREGCRY